jgi:hypothetical protein
MDRRERRASGGKKRKKGKIHRALRGSFCVLFRLLFSPLLREWHILFRHFMENFFAFDRRQTAERLCSNPFALALRSYKRKVLAKGREELRPNNDSISETPLMEEKTVINQPEVPRSDNFSAGRFAWQTIQMSRDSSRKQGSVRYCCDRTI